MTNNETLARRWLASKHWGGWRHGMSSQLGHLSEGDESPVHDPTWGTPIPDLSHPGTRAFLLEDVRKAWGFLVSCPFSDDDGKTWHLWRGRQCFSADTEAAALIAALESVQ